jgi:hypothetical protein
MCLVISLSFVKLLSFLYFPFAIPCSQFHNQNLNFVFRFIMFSITFANFNTYNLMSSMSISSLLWYLSTYLLTSWCRIIFEKLIVTQHFKQ